MRVQILIVEDEQIVAADLEAKLIRMGHQVAGIAASAEEAFAMAARHCPDLILMDIQLQGNLNGLEAARQLQQLCTAQIIFVTAFAAVFRKDPNRMKLPGICLTKPFSAPQLQAALQAALHEKAHGRAPSS